MNPDCDRCALESEGRNGRGEGRYLDRETDEDLCSNCVSADISRDFDSVGCMEDAP